MTHSHVKQGLAAACLVGLGGAFSAHAATVQTASEDTTGEAMAKAFYTQNRAEFNSNPPAITALQVKAALAEGERDQYASPPQSLGDGGQWTLPWRLIQRDGTE